MNIEVRSMHASDLGGVMENENAAYPIPWSRGVFEDCLAGNNVCLVCCVGQDIVGHAVVSFILDEFHLLNICIAPSYAGKGLGRQFLRYLIELAISRNMQMFFLEVRASNHVAIALYESEGFNEVGVRPNYYPAQSGREDAVLMTLQLCFDGMS